jgi:hypothetical protein
MAGRNEIKQAFDAFGQHRGMTKHSGSWYRNGPDVITVLNLQKSQYGPSYYINVGFWITALGEELYPMEHRCHVRLRLEMLLPDKATELAGLLSLEPVVPGRTQQLNAILGDEVESFLQQASSVEGLRKLRREGRLNAFILRPAVQMLTDG